MTKEKPYNNQIKTIIRLLYGQEKYNYSFTGTYVPIGVIFNLNEVQGSARMLNETNDFWVYQYYCLFGWRKGMTCNL